MRRTKAPCTPLPSAITTSMKKPGTNPSRPPERNPRQSPPLRKTTAFSFPAKQAPRAPALPGRAKIFRAIPRESAAIHAPASSGLTAAADAIATTAAATIAVAAADQTAAADVLAAVLDSNAGQAARIVTAVTPALHAPPTSFSKFLKPAQTPSIKLPMRQPVKKRGTPPAQLP